MLPPYDSRLRPARGKLSSAIPAGPAQRFRRHLGHKNAHPAADAESTAALCESKKTQQCLDSIVLTARDSSSYQPCLHLSTP